MEKISPIVRPHIVRGCDWDEKRSDEGGVKNEGEKRCVVENIMFHTPFSSNVPSTQTI